MAMDEKLKKQVKEAFEFMLETMKKTRNKDVDVSVAVAVCKCAKEMVSLGKLELDIEGFGK